MNENTINNDVTMAGESERALLANRYRIIKQLGQGGMGSVWLAEDTQLDGKLFAIKMLPSILVANKRAFNQLKSEALVAMKLTHPNIVTLRAFEENNGNPFLVMDYIDGETLDDWLGNREGERPREPHQESGVIEADIVRLLKPIAEALDYAHTEGVVHRDIKPANVMIRKDGRPFIMDFGIAREIQETMTRVTGRMSSGTLMYMSPEQLNGDMPKPSQDVYSFAAMVYECIKGEPPFSRGNIEYQIMNKDPEPLAYGPASDPASHPAIVDSVMAGLSKKPDDRPKSCVAVLEGNCEKREKESGGREVWPGRSPLREAKSLEACEPLREPHLEACEPLREPRRKFFVKFAAIGLLALGLIGGICALLGKMESNDSNDKFEVIEDGMVQLWEGGPYWAAKNIGADKPEDPGYYFWWGDTVGYKLEGDKLVAVKGYNTNFSFSGDNVPTYGKSISDMEREGWIEKKNGTYTLTSKHDAAQAHLGGAWRMPTNQEFTDLRLMCDWTWTTRNGENGYVVRGRGNYASKSIFFPAAGLGYGASLVDCSGVYGIYRSSVPYSDSNYAFVLYFDSSGRRTSGSCRSDVQSVRPVQGFTK